MTKKIRNSIKAIIVKDDKLLTIKCKDHLGIFYLLPGGGQEHYETMPETLRRECREEINCEVVPGKLLYIREYLSDNHEFAEFDNHVHQIEFMFEASLVDGCMPEVGEHKDPYQTGVEWIDIDSLPNVRLYPKTLKGIIRDKSYNGPIYLGDVN